MIDISRKITDRHFTHLAVNNLDSQLSPSKRDVSLYRPGLGRQLADTPSSRRHQANRFEQISHAYSSLVTFSSLGVALPYNQRLHNRQHSRCSKFSSLRSLSPCFASRKKLVGQSKLARISCFRFGGHALQCHSSDNRSVSLFLPS